MGSLTKIVIVFSVKVTSTMSVFMMGDDCSETLLCRLDWPIDEGKLSDVVLVDHAQNGLLLANVDLWVLNLLLIRRLQFSLFTSIK